MRPASQFCFVSLVLFVVGSPAPAAELTVSIVRQSDGASSFTVLPGATVTYEIRGLLSSGADNEGLAFWSADLQFQQDADIADNFIVWPDHTPMMNFAQNRGFSNPGVDYVGTPIGQTLVQIGGGQNTIANTPDNAPFPVEEEIITGVAHASQALAVGGYTVPSDAGPDEQHVLRLTACLASVINDGEQGPVYHTREVKTHCETAVLTIATPPDATMTGAVTRKSNPSGPGGLCDLPLQPPVKSEPRNTRITEVRIAFDAPPGNPAGAQGGVTIDQKVCPAPGTYVPYAGSSTRTETFAGNELVLNFSPGLENARTYRINLGPLVTSVSGQFVELRGLIGDATGDGIVNSADTSAVVGAWTGSGFSCNTDFNSDGVTNAADRSIVVGYFNSCAP